MPEPRRRRSVAQNFLVSLVRAQLAELVTGEWRPLDVVDLGGGTGGLANALAAQGHLVTVVDPSPDALASLDRRTAEAGLQSRVSGRQGDAASLVDLIGERSADVVVCHRVLDLVEAPTDALAAMRKVLRPGGALSLVVAQRHAAVLSHALAGRVAQARRAFHDGARFDQRRILELVEGAGFAVIASHGLGAIADHVPEALLEAEPGAYAELAELEAEISSDPAFRAVAPELHVFAQAERAH